MSSEGGHHVVIDRIRHVGLVRIYSIIAALVKPSSVYTYLFSFVFALNLVLSGGRLASSDELSIFLTTESLVERGELAISNDLVKNGTFGRDGKFYSGVGIGQPLFAIPVYVAGKFACTILGLEGTQRTLAIRATVSILNQVFAGLIAVVMVAFGIRLGYSKRLAVFLALCLLFTTNLFPYFKSFMREPQLLFLLLGAVYYGYRYRLDGKPKHLLYSGILCGIGMLTRLTLVFSVPALCVYLVFIVFQRGKEEGRAWRWTLGRLMFFAAPIAVALVLNAIYNYIQFAGVAVGPYSEVQFATPFFVGLYGLLLSSGKSYFLYAPITLLSVAAMSTFIRKFKPEALLFIAIFLSNVLFFANYTAWAGDGSWGPRYLISTLPFLVLPAGALIRETIVARRWALVLSAIGLAIQVGGVSIYLGSYIREIGEYPYTKEFSDPEFLYKSHFIPNYSPVVGHWEMLVRNIPINLSSERPRFAITDTEQRIPLSEETQSNLRYTLDFWFMYALYAGIRGGLIALVLLSLLALTIFFGSKTLRAVTTPSQAQP